MDSFATVAPLTLAPVAVANPAMMNKPNAVFCQWWHFSIATALSGAAGIRATLPVFILSLLYQVDPQEYPIADEMHWLKHGEICALLGLVLLIEILADQIPALDHAIHAVLAPAHPLMGAAAAIAPNYCGGLLTRVPMAMVGGSLAALVHSGKVVTRVGSTGASGGLLNPVLSHCESISAVALVIFSILSPVVSVGATALFAYIGYLGFKWGRAYLLGDDGQQPCAQDEEMGRCSSSTRLMEKASAPPLEELVDLSEDLALEDTPEDNSDHRAEAETEINRVLAAPSAHLVLGGGTALQTKAEFRRLVLLLHPDRGFCAGERANIALRRVVQAHQALHAGA